MKLIKGSYMIGTYLQKTSNFFKNSPLDRTEIEKWCMENKTSLSVAMVCFEMCDYDEQASLELLNNSDTSLTTVILQKSLKIAPTVYESDLYFNNMLFTFEDVNRMVENKNE